MVNNATTQPTHSIPVLDLPAVLLVAATFTNDSVVFAAPPRMDADIPPPSPLPGTPHCRRQHTLAHHCSAYCCELANDATTQPTQSIPVLDIPASAVLLVAVTFSNDSVVFAAPPKMDAQIPPPLTPSAGKPHCRRHHTHRSAYYYDAGGLWYNKTEAIHPSYRSTCSVVRSCDVHKRHRRVWGTAVDGCEDSSTITTTWYTTLPTPPYTHPSAYCCELANDEKNSRRNLPQFWVYLQCCS
jgi:hypothetical protein